MDKSEGRSFLSKTFSSLSETFAKWYHTGNMKMSISSLKRARNEKLQALGNKIYELMAAGKAVSADVLKTEYKSIVDLDAQISLAEKDLKKIQEMVPEKAEKTAKAENAPKAAKADAKNSAAKKAGAKKAAPAAKNAKKKPAAKKASKPMPVVKTKATPAVKTEAKPALRKESKPAVKPEAEIKLKKDEA